jgi:hypothetical protein
MRELQFPLLRERHRRGGKKAGETPALSGWSSLGRLLIMSHLPPGFRLLCSLHPGLCCSALSALGISLFKYKHQAEGFSPPLNYEQISLTAFVPNAAYFLIGGEALVVRLLAAAFAIIPMFINSVKAAASCRTPRRPSGACSAKTMRY